MKKIELACCPITEVDSFSRDSLTLFIFTFRTTMLLTRTGMRSQLRTALNMHPMHPRVTDGNKRYHVPNYLPKSGATSTGVFSRQQPSGESDGPQRMFSRQRVPKHMRYNHVYYTIRQINTHSQTRQWRH